MAKKAKKASADATTKPNTPSLRWGVAGILVLVLIALGLSINNWVRIDQRPDWQHDISTLHSAIAALKIAQNDDARASRLSALEAQIADIETTLSALQARPTPADNLNAIAARIRVAVRDATPFAEILREAVAKDARWQVLEQWAQDPPPSLDQLWQEMAARIPETAAIESAAEAIKPQGWVAWLAPLTKAIELRPLNPREDLVDVLTDAIARRDSIGALQAIRALSGDPQDMIAWRQAYADRRALNQALDGLIRTLEQ